VQATAARDQAAGAAAPALAAPAVATSAAETDCDAVGRHLAELEDDMTHGPVDRRDEADAEASPAPSSASISRRSRATPACTPTSPT
jgi:hypothetical protein